jgi:hypothetical protein
VKCHTDSSLFSDTPSAPGILEAASSPDPATAALRYLALGFSVIPLRGKVPRVTWRAYQQRRPSQAELLRWARRGLFQNVGIVCGDVSGRLVVFDFDAPEAYEGFRTRFPDLSQTYTVATGGGGWHVYLRVETLPPSLRGPGAELRANGHQAVAPPSIHPNGKLYSVYLPQDIRQVSDLKHVVDWLRSIRTPARRAWPGSSRRAYTESSKVNPVLASAIADYFHAQGYRQKGDWLNGPCIYPERHAHSDHHRSFGFNVRSGYGYCFVCGSMLAKDIAQHLSIDPTPLGGVAVSHQ